MDAPATRMIPQVGHQVVLIENDLVETTSEPRGDAEKARLFNTRCSTDKQTVDAKLHIWTGHAEAGERASVHAHGNVVEVVGKVH